ncbi:hypothetical protein [Burkholderia sp. Ac-20379]|uniref:hypothetical protein n=1 Tax=Burkholderia sp. Ac-20379 TaxID=2703900 RepID=UPI00197D5E18|nr:hypothetical protein [Burkholderia sp. Ac-20379]MBN3727264.1 hypothetical protein [Burkholderia sp. Ac-20379]
MAVNKYKPHVWVVPEDDANRELANGFVLQYSVNDECIDIRPPSGGWPKVLNEFTETHIAHLRNLPHRHLVLLIDFDGNFQNRLQYFKSQFPVDIADRVYVLGTLIEPEDLRVDLGQSLEEIGEQLADACANNVDGLWTHGMVLHNASERARLMASVKNFLF